MQVLWNPFVRFKSSHLFLIGVCSYFLGWLSSVVTQMAQDGVMDVHYRELSWGNHLLVMDIALGCLWIITYVGARTIYSEVRAIDILSVSLVSRIPLYLPMWLYYLTPALRASEKLVDISISNRVVPELSWGEWISLMGVSLFSLVCLAWFLILHFNGFKVVANARKGKHYVVWILSILLAELSSLLIMHYFIL